MNGTTSCTASSNTIGREEIARRITLTVNPVNGFPQITEVARRVEPPVAPVVRAGTAEPTEPTGPLLVRQGRTAAQLVDVLGIPSYVATTALAAQGEDELMALAAQHEGWLGLMLLDLATGDSIESITERLEVAQPAVQTGDSAILDSLKRPAAQTQFAFIDDQDELRRVIESGDLKAWRTFLHPEQRRYVDASFSGPFRLSGGAGTGKTVVLIHRGARTCAASADGTDRADHLHHQPRGRVARGRDRTRSLARSGRTPGRTGRVRGRCGFAGRDRGSAGRRRGGGGGRGGARRAPSSRQLADSGDAVARRGRGCLDAAARIDRHGDVPVRRVRTRGAAEPHPDGGGVPAGAPPRPWGCARPGPPASGVGSRSQAYRVQSRLDGTLDYAEAAAVAAAHLETQGPLVDHVLVDEGQDLSPVHWQMLRALVAPGTDDLFLAEDSHQRIYGAPVVLGRYGIRIVGRSRRLTLNYRTTAQNLHYALGILEGGSYVDLEENAETTGYRSARTGPAPRVDTVESLTAELDTVSEIVRGWIEGGTPPDSIAVLVRDRYQRQRLAGALTQAGLPAREIDRDRPGPGRVSVLTMHRAKGTEFSRVVLAGVGWSSSDAEQRRLAALDPAERHDADLRARSLVYVAATRARDVLAVVRR